ncbi:OsmC family protein [Chromobacterium sp. ASV23]|uniref:OsmC family protein n=1 Tax=Chromobacterium sp. ASV23 TaxID=2795110 RepID=UPI0018ED9ADF|nr:OsmC family protein [Chromobacterium sp. ASV23]
MEVKVTRGSGKLQQVVMAGNHTLLADEPPAIGGEDTGFTPHQLLAASLGACTALTLALYAKRKAWDLADVDVRVAYAERDGAFVLERHMRYIGQLDAEQKARLTEIANQCPIHKVLSGQIRIVSTAE